MQGEHTAGAAKPLIGTAEIHPADAVLLQRRGTHHTRLDGHVEVGGGQCRPRICLEHLGNGEKLGMSGSLERVELP